MINCFSLVWCFTCITFALCRFLLQRLLRDVAAYADPCLTVAAASARAGFAAAY